MGLCLLQEVDHFTDYFEPMFNSLGLATIYIQRPSREDGCVIAYDPNRLKLLAVDQMYFDDLAVDGGPMFEKNNVGLFAKFSLLENPGTEFAVSSNHLYWNPSRPQVKLRQSKYLMDRFAVFRGDAPGVLAGDFNSVPQSDPYQLITTGKCREGIITGLGYNLKSPKFYCDTSLSRLCKWLRLLGYNSFLETPEQLELRSKREFSEIFQFLKQTKRQAK
jgi:hypothetical protein